jgi:Na+/melibiose symporter-like transporter
LAFLLAPIRSLGGGVGFLIPLSMFPDVIAAIEKQHGIRNEGLMYSVVILFQKISSAAAIGLSSFVLGFAGYETPVHGEEDVQPGRCT